MGRIVIHTGIDNTQLDRGLQQVESRTKSAGATAGKNLAAMQKGFEKSRAEADKLGTQIDILNAKQRAIAERAPTYGVMSPKDAEAMEILEIKIEALRPRWEEAEQAAAQYQARIEEISAAPPAEVTPLKPSAESASALADQFKKAAGSVASFAKKAISSIGSIMTKAGNGIKSVVTKVGNGIRSMTSRISGLMRRTSKDTNGLTDAIGKTVNRIKNLLVSVLVFNMMRKAFKEFRNYIGKALMKNKEFVTSVGQLKGAMKSAFAPILAYIVPAITTLISWLATAMSYIARFVQMLSGQVATTNKAGDSTSALSKGMDDLAGSTKAAGDAAKKSLASFDLINQMQATDAGGGGAGATEIPTLAPVKIDTAWIDEFVKKLKDLDVDYQYFFDLGHRVGEWINKGLASIDWAWIQEWTTSTIAKIAAFLNGAVAGTDWMLVGFTIAQAFNTILMGAHTWLEDFNWRKWGQSLGELINGAIYSIQWSEIGDTLSAYVMSVINTISSAISKVDWVYLGAHLSLSINRFFNGIDWKEAGRLISNGMKSALSFLTTAVTETNWKAIGEDVRNFLIGIDWKGVWDDFKRFIKSVFTGLGEFISGLFATSDDRLSFESAGNMLGGMLQNMINIGLAFIESYDWGAAIISMMNGILSFLRGIDWADLGSRVSDAFKAVLGQLATAFTSKEWNDLSIEFGNSIGDMIRNIDWEGLATLLGQLASGLLQGISTAIAAAVFGEEYTGQIESFADSITENLEKIRAISEEKYNELIELQSKYAGTEMGAFVFAAKLEEELKALQEQSGQTVDQLEADKDEIWNTAPGGRMAFEENTDEAFLGAAKGVGRVKDAVQEAHDYKPTGESGLVADFRENADTIAQDSKTLLGDAIGDGIKAGTEAGSEHVKTLGTDVSDTMAAAGASAEKDFSKPTDKAFGDTSSSGIEDMNKLRDDTEAIFAPIAETAEKDFAQPVEKIFSVLFTGTSKDNEDLVKSIKDIWSPVPAWFETTISGPIARNFGTSWTDISKAALTSLQSMQNAFNPLAGWFSTSVISPIENSFASLFDGIKSGMNGMISNIEYGLNRMADAVNRIRITVPPIPSPLGGNVWGGAWVNLGMSYTNLPRLATGAVIPPNKEFAAILGDQKSGTNIETPEALLRQIVREELSNSGGNRTERFTAEATGQLAPLIRMLRIELKREDAREGASLSDRVVIA